MKAKNRLFILISFVFLYFPVEAFAQKDSEDEITIFIKDGIPVERILVVNGVLVKDSLVSIRLKSELVNFKTKTKTQRVSESVADKLGIKYNPNKLNYKFEIIEAKDVIIDPETMRLIKIK